MGNRTKRTSSGIRVPGSSYDPTGDVLAEAENTTFQRVDSAALQPRPDSVAETWKEREFDERAIEQEPLWQATSKLASRTFEVEAEGLRPQADAAVYVTEQQKSLLEQAQQRLSEAIDALAPFRTRGPKAKSFYLLRTCAFLIGDIAGISGAAISLGEIPANAYILAISAATATVVAGLVGKDIKVTRDSVRRHREPETLTDTQKPFQHLFTGKDQGVRVVRSMVWVSGAIGVLVAGGIFALRSSIEGSLSGLVYGAFAAAIALGSAASSFAYGDEIADQLDNNRADYDRELKRHLALSASDPLKNHLEKQTETASIQDEHTERGKAAMNALTALKWRILARNPGTVGHGPAGAPEIVVGRRNREVGEQA